MHIELKLDKRKSSKDSRYPIKVYVSEGRRSYMVATGFFCKEKEFDPVNGQLIGSGYKRPNQKLTTIINRAEKETEGYALPDAVSIIRKICDADRVKVVTLGSFWEKVVDGYDVKNTIANYRTAFNRINRFCDIYKVSFDSINQKWLNGLNSSMSDLRPNSKVQVFRCLRHVINVAIDEEVTSVYPFKRFKLKGEETRKRSLTVERLRQLRDAELSGRASYMRDMFMLSFYLIGINAMDLFSLSPVLDGRVSYRRSKTKRLYDIKVEPEAQALIDRHKGKAACVDVSQRYDDVKRFSNACDFQLSRIMPGVTLYWARHTWATLAAELDIPMDTISVALGHSFGLRITNIYVKHSIKKVDEANRKVLDYLADA